MIIAVKWGKLLVGNDGVTIAKEFALKCAGVQVLRRALGRSGLGAVQKEIEAEMKRRAPREIFTAPAKNSAFGTGDGRSGLPLKIG